jgi:NADPH-dependent 2,4-dienoyl-CoA reductase/sulfur reductase-like enzyme/rhodanese-related sulfurtransferase
MTSSDSVPNQAPRTTTSTRDSRRVIIIGGVAGGASCAARLRRLDEHAHIILVERGPYVSYANCGLPYFVGGVIPRESSLLVASEQTFRENFHIEVRTHCEAIAISTRDKTVQLRDTLRNTTTLEPFDQLVLAPGAAPIRPPLAGIDLPGVFQVRTVPDVQHIKQWLEWRRTALTAPSSGHGPTPTAAKRAVVVGGGFIGLEMAENLTHLGLQVTVLQRDPHVLAPLDADMAVHVEEHLRAHDVRLVLQDDVVGIEPCADGSLQAITRSATRFDADIIVLGIGVRPEIDLARDAGLAIGPKGGIVVDEQMRTNHPDIFAVGDAVEVSDFVTAEPTLVALAGPANRQGRIVADVIAGRTARYRGTQGTAIVGLFGAAAAWTGVNERTLRQLGDDDYEKVYLYPNSHASYYPGATRLSLKVLFRKSNGKLLGAQAFGHDAVDKQIDTVAMALRLGATVYDLEEAELCYAPQFSSAKSPINFAGMIASDVLRHDMPLTHWPSSPEALLLDVRNDDEVATDPIPDAVHIPLPQLRGRLHELPRERTLHVTCKSGQRAYYATRILMQHGFRARNISGGNLARHSRWLANC